MILYTKLYALLIWDKPIYICNRSRKSSPWNVRGIVFFPCMFSGKLIKCVILFLSQFCYLLHCSMASLLSYSFHTSTVSQSDTGRRHLNNNKKRYKVLIRPQWSKYNLCEKDQNSGETWRWVIILKRTLTHTQLKSLYSLFFSL